MQEERLTPAESELESALRSLRPARAAIDRDRLMFQAGRASARRGGRVWLGATMALAAALGVSLVVRPGPREVVRIVRVEAEAPKPEVTPARSFIAARAIRAGRLGRGEYLRLREEVLAKGLDALPQPETTAAPEPREDLEKLLGIPRPKAGRRNWWGFEHLIPGDRS